MLTNRSQQGDTKGVVGAIATRLNFSGYAHAGAVVITGEVQAPTPNNVDNNRRYNRPPGMGRRGPR